LHLACRCVYDIDTLPGYDHEGKAFRIIVRQWEHAGLGHVGCRWVYYPSDIAEVLDDEKISRVIDTCHDSVYCDFDDSLAIKPFIFNGDNG